MAFTRLEIAQVAVLFPKEHSPMGNPNPSNFVRR